MSLSLPRGEAAGEAGPVPSQRAGLGWAGLQARASLACARAQGSLGSSTEGHCCPGPVAPGTAGSPQATMGTKVRWDTGHEVISDGLESMAMTVFRELLTMAVLQHSPKARHETCLLSCSVLMQVLVLYLFCSRCCWVGAPSNVS